MFFPVPPQPETDPTRRSDRDGLGRASLACAIAAWVVEGTLLLADLGWVPWAVKLGGVTLVAAAVLWLAAVVGGLAAAVGGRSKAGLLAVAVCLLLPAGICCLVLSVGSGWLD